MLIRKEALEVWRASSNDSSRYSLNGVLVEADGSTVATNGHWLARFKPAKGFPYTDYPAVQGCDAAAPGELKPFIMPLDSVKALRKAVPKRHACTVLSDCVALDVPQTNANGHAVLAVTDLENPQVSRPAKVEGTFPRYEAVMPKPEAMQAPIGFSAHYLKAICETAIAQAGGAKATCYLALRLALEGHAEKPATVTYNGQAGTTEFVLMPVNLK